MSTASLTLESRQETAEMDVTLFDLGEEESTIHCEGSMGEATDGGVETTNGQATGDGEVGRC